jgi:hypothetical protein
MIQTPLRLVVDHGAESAPSAVELFPSSRGVMHIHLHVGPQSGGVSPAAATPPEDREKGQSGKGKRRPLVMSAMAVLIAVVAFDVGARTGGGHAKALAAAKASAAGPGELPAAVQLQLAQRPTVTPPAGADTQPGRPDPFGLQH